ncbi:hypothetical protein C2E31_22915 [Rhodopirellula baltica]|nr:hypothetical protein C2E31_22915 [Rhodopirellula baltica]
MLFTSSNGGGQNLLHVLTLMLFIASVASIVSFIIARWVATLALAVAASAVITDLLFMIYFMYSIAYRDSADPHAVEAYLLIPIVFTVVTAPLVGLSSFGIGRIANRYFHDQPLHSESAAATERPADPQHPTSV